MDDEVDVLDLVLVEVPVDELVEVLVLDTSTAICSRKHASVMGTLLNLVNKPA